MALLQLAAQGPQDRALVGTPSMSFFRCRYKRHTPFATEFKDVRFDTTATFGSRAVVKLGRLGDLVHTCYLELVFKKTGETFYPAEACVESVDVVIGGTVIDSHDATWFRVYDELYRKEDHRAAYRELTDFSGSHPVGSVKTCWLPLIFWFCKDPAHSLPLASLQHHEIEFVFHFASHVAGIDMSFDPCPKLVCEYVFLDCPERDMFQNSQHTLLIEQLQRSHVSTPASETINVPVPFTRPCKSVAWVFCDPERHGVFTASGRGLESAEVYAPMQSAQLLINGVERGDVRPGSWYRAVESFARSRQIPSAGVYAMFFALDAASSTQPSGTINFSRLNGELHLVMKRIVPGSMRHTILNEATETLEYAARLTMLRMYAQSWNQLIIAKGVAALAWTT